MKLKILVTSIVFSTLLLMSGCAEKELDISINTDIFDNNIQTSKASLKVIYTKIQVAPVQVISGLNEVTPSQKKMYTEISEYLTSEYKKIVKSNPRYSLSDVKAKDTLVLQGTISTVEVHFDDPKWNQHTLIAMGLNSVTFNAYMYEFVRVLGKNKLIDSMNAKVVSQISKVQDKHIIKINGDDLVFSDIKPALDSWLVQVKVDLSSK